MKPIFKKSPRAQKHGPVKDVRWRVPEKMIKDFNNFLLKNQCSAATAVQVMVRNYLAMEKFSNIKWKRRQP
jgi:hypothetical protein